MCCTFMAHSVMCVLCCAVWRWLKSTSSRHMLPPIPTTPWACSTSSELTEKERATTSSPTCTTGKSWPAETGAAQRLVSRSCAVSSFPEICLQSVVRENKMVVSHLSRTLLWHGSRLSNWVGILREGLRVAPPEAPVTGYMVISKFWYSDISLKSFWLQRVLAQAYSANTFIFPDPYCIAEACNNIIENESCCSLL